MSIHLFFGWMLMFFTGSVLQQPLDILRNVFGYQSFRGLQEPVIDHVLAGKDALLLMPTGSGKSLCYQIPAIVRPGLGIVVSPLIALMQDQVARLQSLGVRAAHLNSMLTNAEAWDVKHKMMARELDLLYVSPERLMMEGFLKALDQVELALFAIDEAHCVSQWGHNFRPEYLQLHVLKERYPGVPRLALTATADLQTRAEILKRLELPEKGMFVGGFDRPNIRYLVTPKTNWKRQLVGFLRGQEPGASGIVYRLTRKSVDATAEYLRECGFNAIPYHAGMDDAERRANQQRFLDEPGAIVVATIAFGIGIDKPDVRFVAHLDMPRSIEEYHQQTGRAGRDGLPATAWMTFGAGDVVLMRKLIESGEAEPEFQKVEKKKLQAMARFCETAECRRRLLLRYFGENTPEQCGNCDVCLGNDGSEQEDWPATTVAQKALLCIFETGQMFGAAHLTNVLRGSRDRKVLENGHAGLGSYGAGRDLSEQQWRSVFTQLIAQELVDVREDGFRTFRLNQQGAEVLRGEREVVLQRAKSEPAAATRTKVPGDVDVANAPTGERPQAGSEALFERLRALRLELARQKRVPAFQVFADATLRDMAQRQPRTPEEMLEVKGVGEVKLARYGEAFLQVLREFE
ncbi:MAG: DNA helicase RecQ [Armatimonadia bacterium]